ncbi:MAG: valine--tRNA ligase, partial [Acidimicrobiia bacterium]
RYTQMVGRTLVLPLVGREIPVVADEAVDPDFGTGAVKVTPAHDPNDFEIAARHGLPPVDIFTEDAVVNEAGGRFAGLDRFAARTAVKDALSSEAALAGIEEHRHNVGACYRCGTVVEPRLSLQWFVRSAPLAAPAVAAVRDDRTVFVPERWEKLYFDWMENLRDWCVSRQIWWGHRIPAWYCTGCDAVVVSVDDPTSCTGCGGADLVQDDDVLDTWFSSALWPFTTLGWPEATEDLYRFYPNAMLHTGFDIIYFWVARMMQMGLQFCGDVPFRKVAIHGLVRDADGRKMSKSYGNVVDPLELADRYGADALRFAMVRAASPGHDVPLAEEWVQGGRNFVNKLWNASRFVAMNLDGASLASLEAEPLDLSSGSLPDRWILSRLAQVTAGVDDGFERYDFADGVQRLQAFTWDEFCDWYVELAKRPLGAGGGERHRTQVVLAKTLGGILRLLHPAVPFVTEELWDRLGGDGLLAVAPWPGPDAFPVDEAPDAAMAGLTEVVSAIRRFRSEHRIPPSRRLQAFVVPAGAAQQRALVELSAELSTLAGLDRLELVEARDPAPGEQRLVAAGATIALPLEGVVDAAAAVADLDRQIERHREEQARAATKLADEKFLTRAPANVVDDMRRRHAAAAQALAALEAQRVQLT